MKKSLFILFTYLLTIFTTTAQQSHFTLTGLTNGIPENTKVYLMDGATNINIDSTTIQNNQFVFTGDAHPYKEYWVMAKYGDKFDYKSLYVENTNMTFDARETDFFNAKVSGSKLQAQADELFYSTKEWRDKWSKVNLMVRDVPKTNQAKKDSLRQVRAVYRQKETNITHQFIKDHPDYLISLKHLTFLKNKLSKKEVQLLLEGMPDELKQTEDGQSIKVWLDKSIKLAIGDKAPDFQLPDLKGEQIALSNFKGNYVLLEFGASGCGPCRMENPNLLKAYQKHQDKGFEILSVWLDKNKDNWSNAVAKDQMIWTSVCDLKGNKGVVPITYNVTYIPTNYLLNPAGEVIAKDLRGDDLQKELIELFEVEK